MEIRAMVHFPRDMQRLLREMVHIPDRSQAKTLKKNFQFLAWERPGTGFPNFANKTFANGECPEVHWRKYSGPSPIGESPIGILAKVKWTLAN